MWTLRTLRSSLALAGSPNNSFGASTSLEWRGGFLDEHGTLHGDRVDAMIGDRADDLKQFYRALSGDERNSAILKRALR